MRKMITTLCAVAVAVGSVLAVNALKENELKGSSVKSFSKDSFTPSNVVDEGNQGGVFYIWNFRKVSYAPESGMMVTAYDQKHGSGLKATGATATLWNEEVTPGNVNPSGAFYSPCATTVAFEKYAIAILPDATKTDESLFISVSNLDEGTWSPKILVASADKATPIKVRSALGDMTKDADGNYCLMLSVLYEYVNYTDRKLALIVGKTKDPVNGPWTFSNFNDMKFLVGAGSSITENVTDFHCAWGKNGFGIAAIIGQNATDSSTFNYAYTRNYGNTWEVRGDDEGAVGYKKLNKTIKPAGMMMPCAGDSIVPTDTSKTIYFSKGEINNNFSMTVDENNDVHFLVNGYASTADDSYYPGYYYTYNNVPTNGHWLFTKKFDLTGNPEDVTNNEGWSVSFVAHWSGGKDDLPVDVGGTLTDVEFYYPNVMTLSISSCGNGVLMASWLDRPRLNPLLGTQFGDAIGIPYTGYWKFVCNPYVIASYDNGKTWDHYTAPGDSSKPLRAYEIETYTDNKVNELGFTVAIRGSSTVSGDSKTGIAYAAYAIPQLNAPSSTDLFAAGASGPGTAFHKFEQKYYFMKIEMNGKTGIATEVMALNKNFDLEQNYPNPFNPTTFINFNMYNEGKVNLTIYNAKGEYVTNLIDAKMNKGAHTANFNGSGLNSGVYFYKLTVDGKSMVQKMVLTK